MWNHPLQIMNSSRQGKEKEEKRKEIRIVKRQHRADAIPGLSCQPSSSFFLRASGCCQFLIAMVTTFTASHRHTLKAFEDGIRGFSLSLPRLSSISSTWSTSTNRVEDFLLVLTPPPCTESVVHPHHGGWPASYVVKGVGNQIRLP